MRSWTDGEQRLLRRMWRAMQPIGAILPAFPDRKVHEILGKIDELYGLPTWTRIEWSKEKTPVERAQDVLGARVRPDRRSPSGFFLDGRPARLSDLIRAANHLLHTLGHPPLLYPDVERAQWQ